MTRGKRKKKHSLRKSKDENDYSQIGQGEEIATPPAKRTSPRKGRSEELTEMNLSNPLQTQLEIGNDYYYAASAVSPNAHHQDTEAPLFSIDRIAKPQANAAQTLEDQHFEEPESQQPFFDCLTQVWHREKHLFAMQLEEYSNEAHLSTVMAAIQYSKTLADTNTQNQDDFPPDFEGKDDDSYLALQNPTKAPIISKDFFRALPHCPTIHWASQMRNNPKLCFCPCSIHYKPGREKNKISIQDDHECKGTAMTSQELLKHLKNEGGSTHAAISLYLEKLNTFS
jgi:hypothetical protein